MKAPGRSSSASGPSPCTTRPVNLLLRKYGEKAHLLTKVIDQLSLTLLSFKHHFIFL